MKIPRHLDDPENRRPTMTKSLAMISAAPSFLNANGCEQSEKSPRLVHPVVVVVEECTTNRARIGHGRDISTLEQVQCHRAARKAAAHQHQVAIVPALPPIPARAAIFQFLFGFPRLAAAATVMKRPSRRSRVPVGAIESRSSSTTVCVCVGYDFSARLRY